MKNIKKFITIILIIMSSSIVAQDTTIPLRILAPNESTEKLNAKCFNINNISYKITNETEKTVEVTFLPENYTQQSFDGYTQDYKGKITIPSIVKHNNTEYKVTAIGNYAFRNCKNLIKLDFVLCLDLLDEQYVALADLVLLSARFDYCKHEKHLTFINAIAAKSR